MEATVKCVYIRMPKRNANRGVMMVLSAGAILLFQVSNAKTAVDIASHSSAIVIRRLEQFANNLKNSNCHLSRCAAARNTSRA